MGWLPAEHGTISFGEDPQARNNRTAMAICSGDQLSAGGETHAPPVLTHMSAQVLYTSLWVRTRRNSLQRIKAGGIVHRRWLPSARDHKYDI